VFEWGIDFESDATPNYMANVIAQIGDESLRWLDEQIAIGDGTTEPQGLFVGTTTAVGTVSSHTAGSMSYADIVQLAFGIDKAHRNAFGGSFTRFVMKDSQYKQLWQVATGVTGDARPVFANPTFQWKSYQLGDYPVSVQNNITTGNLALVNLRGYRMYRRQGISFLQEESGRTLRLLHERMLMARMRWGGQMTLAGYVGEMTA
jgi:HK97 family phage major capsid protein